jgi:galactokinase/mevalonate kinase-like predicted kinase
MVAGATIDKYFYVFLTPDQGGSLQVTSSDYRAFYRHDNGDQHNRAV